MTVVHFATELSGGAGGFVKSVHLAMQGQSLPSVVLTRERSSLQGVVTLKPSTRLARSLQARTWTMLGKLGLIRDAYALFGVQTCPVAAEDIRAAIGAYPPSAFIFYWISRFIDFETMLQLRRTYPDVPIVLVCTDEAFLTGGCHYSHGCERYQGSCGECPATPVKALQNRIEQEVVRRQKLVAEIDPIVVYPTTNMREMGARSSVLRSARAGVIPLGAFSCRELELAKLRREERARSRKDRDKLTLLVRSSTEFRKGSDLLVAAVEMASRKRPELRARVRVISIGDDALTAAQLGKHVEHASLGYVTREELIRTYCQADAFVCTSRVDAGPLMINECVALGIYVISTPVGVARDLIVSPEHGLITHDISADALCAPLLQYVDHHDSGVALSRTPAGAPASLTFENYIRAVTRLIPSAEGENVS